MIIENLNSQLIANWINEQKIYEDLGGEGFFYRDCNEGGEESYYSIPPELTGLFRPAIYNKEYILKSCTGKISLEGKPTKYEEPFACKLYQLEKGDVYPLSRHDESLLATIAFAGFHHKNQKRKADNSPYIFHLIEVCQLIQSVAGIKDMDILKAALLHDIAEDTHVCLESLNSLFGTRIASLVEELTCYAEKDKKLKKKMLYDQISKASNDSKIIKLADIISNATFLPDWPTAQLNEYLKWCDSIAELCKQASPDLFDFYQLERHRK